MSLNIEDTKMISREAYSIREKLKLLHDDNSIIIDLLRDISRKLSYIQSNTSK